MSPRPAPAEVDVEPRRTGVRSALAAVRPERAPHRGDERPELRVVASPAKRRRQNWRVGTLAGGLLFLALFAIVGAQTLIVQHQQRLDQLDARTAAAEEQAEQLKIELAELQSPERIVQEATERLGMVAAPSPVYLLPAAGDDARAAEVPAPTPTTTTPTTAPATTAPSTTTATSTPKGTTAKGATAKGTTAKGTTAKGATSTSSGTSGSSAGASR